jgi:hypothetical protein
MMSHSEYVLVTNYPPPAMLVTGYIYCHSKEGHYSFKMDCSDPSQNSKQNLEEMFCYKEEFLSMVTLGFVHKNQ